ncbi:MAG: tripartite tricarboxylate transporter substrate-binding protein [Alphaproteobacteria bacterium]|nr:tripartite tricarboxylate transporter substrate-binding protein [Alphaproteobacteria bacterium]
MSRKSVFLSLGLGAVIGLGALCVDQAAAAGPSWKGKTFNVVIRSSPGGGYDFYGRLIARHMPKYLPGKPRSIATNMSGAGGIVAANYLMNRAKRDGTVIAILTRGVTLAQKLNEPGIKYDVAKLNPIGSTTASTWVWVIKGDHPVKSLTQLKTYKGEIKFSGTGRGSASYQRVKLLEVDGYPVRVITGYDGSEEKVLAIARGDVEATSGSYESLRTFIRDEKLTILGRMGYHPETDGAEQATEVMSKNGAALAAFAGGQDIAGRPFFGPPGLKPDVLKALRVAFRDALKDKDLLAEAKKARRSIGYTSGEDMVKIYAQVLNAPESVVARFKGLMAVPVDKLKGNLVSVKKGGRVLEIGGKKVRVSKSRSKIMINGAKGKRKALKAGMACTVTAADRNGRFEAKTIDCKS